MYDVTTPSVGASALARQHSFQWSSACSAQLSVPFCINISLYMSVRYFCPTLYSKLCPYKVEVSLQQSIFIKVHVNKNMMETLDISVFFIYRNYIIQAPLLALDKSPNSIKSSCHTCCIWSNQSYSFLDSLFLVLYIHNSFIVNLSLLTCPQNKSPLALNLGSMQPCFPPTSTNPWSRIH